MAKTFIINFYPPNSDALDGKSISKELKESDKVILKWHKKAPSSNLNSWYSRWSIETIESE